MKKQSKISLGLLLIALAFLPQFSFSQCNNTSSYGGGTAPTGGGSLTMSTCNYASEYAPVTGVAAATNYTVTSSISTDYITVRQGTSGGTVIASGVQPLNWTSTVAGNYYIHFNLDAACNTQNSCRTTVLTHVLAPVAPPDTPCDATTITVGCGGTKITGDNTGMTNSGIANPSCGSYAGGDLWYEIIVPASGTVQVETYSGTLSDMAMAVYSVSGGCGGTLTEVACNDNGGFGNMPKVVLSGQTPGNTLYVRMWDKNNDQTGTFEIDAADLSSNYCLTNNAIDLGSGCAQLTSATNNQLGSIWDADDKLDFTTDWTYDFTVNLGSSNGGADGITFVIQNDPAGLAASGASGGSMGSAGITNSLIVEIDTYLNTEDRNDGISGVACSGGLEPDHLDIWLNGDVNPGSSSGCPGPSGTRYIPNGVALTNGGSQYDIENGLDHILRIDYVSATQTLTATVLNAAGTITYGTVSYSPVDPTTLFGTNAPYFGFTASTGGLNNLQTACLAQSLILPVTLASMDVKCDDGRVLLDWTTSAELNNDYYQVERSIDGINFEPVGIVEGTGNSDVATSYAWVDESPVDQIAYYRFKQVDFNGDYVYSDVLASECYANGEIKVYPNPAKRAFYFDYSSSGNEVVKMELYNMAGQLVKHAEYLNLPKGVSQNEVNLEELNNGIYYLKFYSQGKQYVQKLSVVD